MSAEALAAEPTALERQEGSGTTGGSARFDEYPAGVEAGGD
jgi:hypothetical protein